MTSDWGQNGPNWPQIGQTDHFFSSPFIELIEIKYTKNRFENVTDLSHMMPIWPLYEHNVASMFITGITNDINRNLISNSNLWLETTGDVGPIHNYIREI